MKRVNITIPADHHAAFRKRAAELGVTFSEFASLCMLPHLTKRQQKQLKPRRKRGRPAKGNP